jgi:hypothetical protein
MTSVNEWVMMRMMMNLAYTRREEEKPSAGMQPTPVEEHLSKDGTTPRAGFLQ